ncbi:MAG: LysM peptidoglycan-binding domain-containing protein [Simkaniaceae bacterium]|nr:LysM peptidoglycan-binding domain-containing protein [Simkaniaceae bacterium]
MNRKDNIIVAVILNAMLLVILFFSFVKKEENSPLSKGVKAPAPTLAVAPPKKVPPMLTTKPNVPSPVQGAEIKPPIEMVVVPPPPPSPVQEVEPVPPKEIKKETPPSAKTYMVQRGDSLDRIARRLNVTIDDLMRLNDLVETRLTVGQELLIPEAKVVPVPKVVENDAKYYVVRGGDNPWTIAQKNHLQVDELLRLNNMDEAKAKRIKPGDKLRIR